MSGKGQRPDAIAELLVFPHVKSVVRPRHCRVIGLSTCKVCRSAMWLRLALLGVRRH